MTGGYHLTDIPRGEFGHLSKILEEVHEAIDAEKQGNLLMTLIELSDIIAAIEGYLVNYADSISLEDLIVMARATQRAFSVGERK
jgi:hypothetical protein